MIYGYNPSPVRYLKPYLDERHLSFALRLKFYFFFFFFCTLFLTPPHPHYRYTLSHYPHTHTSYIIHTSQYTIHNTHTHISYPPYFVSILCAWKVPKCLSTVLSVILVLEGLHPSPNVQLVSS